MGYKNDDEEQRLSLTSADLEEASDGPPLYSETTQFIPSNTALAPPEPKATPDEVRDYIIAVLTQSRGLGVDHARRVAARWSVGTGRELRQYPVAMFRDIFGPEDGWVVYKETRVPYYQQDKTIDEKRRPLYFLGLAGGCVIIIVSIVMMSALEPDDAWVILAMLPVPFVIVIITGFSTYIYARSDPEAKAENELKCEWNKTASGQVNNRT